MAKVVVLSCCQDSIIFQKKCIALEEGESIILGRSDRHNPALKTNGFFEYPAFIAQPILSRLHAEISCDGDGVYLRCFNKNTFINGVRVAVNVRTKIDDDVILILGGYVEGHPTALAEGSVICLVSVLCTSSENFEYFLRVEKEFPFYCQFPGSPPSLSIRLETLYSIVIDRLEILKILARFGESELDAPIRDDSVPDVDKLNLYLEMLSGDVKDYKKLYEARQNDYVSQCILSVAFCRNFRTRNWFITQERKLFILKWMRMLPHEQITFLEMVKAEYNEVPSEELNELAHLHPEFLPTSVKYYKVHFTEAPTFVKQRKICLVEGYCYISLRDMYAPLIKRLRTSLWESTKVARRNLDKIWFDDRIRSMIHFVEEHNICDPDRYKKQNNCGEKVTEHNIHKLCDESFPLCMKILHYHLSRDHHLRNGGRFQYTLFLKAIGLSMSGSLCFWKGHFTKKIEETVFMKRYSYHIRHAYGVEGKMADYPPQNCSEIMKAAPGPLEYHGCPFKVLDEIRMKEALSRSGLKKEVYLEILELVNKGTPQDACKKYFEITQGASYGYATVTHPNIYYDESRKLRKLRKEHVPIAFESSGNVVANSKPSTPLVAPICLDW